MRAPVSAPAEYSKMCSAPMFVRPHLLLIPFEMPIIADFDDSVAPAELGCRGLKAQWLCGKYRKLFGQGRIRIEGVPRRKDALMRSLAAKGTHDEANFMAVVSQVPLLRPI